MEERSCKDPYVYLELKNPYDYLVCDVLSTGLEVIVLQLEVKGYKFLT